MNVMETFVYSLTIIEVEEEKTASAETILA
jgi:hypothetical protein